MVAVAALEQTNPPRPAHRSRHAETHVESDFLSVSDGGSRECRSGPGFCEVNSPKAEFTLGWNAGSVVEAGAVDRVISWPQIPDPDFVLTCELDRDLLGKASHWDLNHPKLRWDA